MLWTRFSTLPLLPEVEVEPRTLSPYNSVAAILSKAIVIHDGGLDVEVPGRILPIHVFRSMTASRPVNVHDWRHALAISAGPAIDPLMRGFAVAINGQDARRLGACRRIGSSLRCNGVICVCAG